MYCVVVQRGEVGLLQTEVVVIGNPFREICSIVEGLLRVMRESWLPVDGMG